MNNSSIGGQIKRYRIQKGISQSDMAAKLHISQPSYGKIENGKSRLDVDRLVKITKILDVDISELVAASEGRTNNINNSTIENGFIEHFLHNNADAYKETIKNLKESHTEIVKSLQEEIKFLRAMVEKR